MNDEAPEKPISRGRPRKRSTEKKQHRVQVAMNDQEKAAADQLAQIHGTSLSAAVAASVTVALDVARFDLLVDRIFNVLKDAAERTALELKDGGFAQYAKAPEPEGRKERLLVVGDVDTSWSSESLMTKYLLTTGKFPVFVDFAGSARGYRELGTPRREIYDGSLRRFAVRIAESYRDSIGLDDVALPYTPERTAVLFGFMVQGGFDKVFRYLDALDAEGLRP